MRTSMPWLQRAVIGVVALGLLVECMDDDGSTSVFELKVLLEGKYPHSEHIRTNLEGEWAYEVSSFLKIPITDVKARTMPGDDAVRFQGRMRDSTELYLGVRGVTQAQAETLLLRIRDNGIDPIVRFPVMRADIIRGEGTEVSGFGTGFIVLMVVTGLGIVVSCLCLTWPFLAEQQKLIAQKRAARKARREAGSAEMYGAIPADAQEAA